MRRGRRPGGAREELPGRRLGVAPLRGISTKSLTQPLRGLERDGFVLREEPGGYARTPLGRRLPGPLDTACAWRGERRPRRVAVRRVAEEAGAPASA